MISLCAPTYDTNGALLVPTRISNPYEAQRRGSVTATLDGGVSVYDGGYSIADQTLRATLYWPTKTLLGVLQYLVAYYGQLVVSCELGAFLAVPSFTTNGRALNLQLRLVSRLDE